MRMTYLGPRGTYTEQATLALASGLHQVELIDLVTAEAVARSVASCEADMGVLACYNYLEGLVQECLDFIYEHELCINDMHRLPIVLSVGQHPENTDNSVHSHPKALAQCSDWLWLNNRDGKQVPATSTAAAAKNIAETRTGMAIASTTALLEYGLELVAEDIGNKKHGRTNHTDFYLVAREHSTRDAESYNTMVAITPEQDRVGLLADIMGIVASHGLNNAKIHSRPAIDQTEITELEPQMFYLEIMANQDEMQPCLAALAEHNVRVLGSYPRHFQ